MNRDINHLLQLQELNLICDEQRQIGESEHMARLFEAIDGLTRKLPSNLRMLYQRLSKRDRVVMAPLYDGACAICGVRVPISQVQAVQRADFIQNCPNCARILYASAVPRWMGQPVGRGVTPKAGISRFSSEALMVPRLAARNKADAIRELVEIMRTGGFIDEVDKLVSAALDRETILSTAVDCGLAFPHVRGVEGGGLSLALGLSADGIPFDNDSPEPVQFVFFTTIPTAVSAFYLKLLAGLSEAMFKAQNRELLLAAETPAQLWKGLVKATRYTVR